MLSRRPDLTEDELKIFLKNLESGASEEVGRFYGDDDLDMDFIVLMDASPFFGGKVTWIKIWHSYEKNKWVQGSTWPLNLPFPFNLRRGRDFLQYVPGSFFNLVNRSVLPIAGSRGIKVTDNIEDWWD